MSLEEAAFGVEQELVKQHMSEPAFDSESSACLIFHLRVQEGGIGWIGKGDLRRVELPGLAVSFVDYILEL